MSLSRHQGPTGDSQGATGACDSNSMRDCSVLMQPSHFLFASGRRGGSFGIESKNVCRRLQLSNISPQQEVPWLMVTTTTKLKCKFVSFSFKVVNDRGRIHLHQVGKWKIRHPDKQRCLKVIMHRYRKYTMDAQRRKRYTEWHNSWSAGSFIIRSKFSGGGMSCSFFREAWKKKRKKKPKETAGGFSLLASVSFYVIYMLNPQVLANEVPKNVHLDFFFDFF